MMYSSPCGAWRIAVAVALGLTFLTTAQATLITYKLSGVGTGTLGSSSFTAAPFTITATADTDDITLSSPGVYRVFTLTDEILIMGLAPASFIGRTIVVDNQNIERAGFSDQSANRSVFFVINSQFSSYDLSTSIGPESGTSSGNVFTNFVTTAGLLSFYPATFGTTASFEAITVIPEPTTAFFGAGLIGVVGLTRRRTRSVAKAA